MTHPHRCRGGCVPLYAEEGRHDGSDRARDRCDADRERSTAHLGARGCGSDHARPRRVVRRLGRRVGPRDVPAHRGGHLRQAERGQEAQLVLGRLRSRRRRPRRGTHLHLHGHRGRRRAHQQLGRPGRDEVDDDRSLPREHARPHDVRHPVLHGPRRGRPPDARGGDHRFRVRRRLHEDHDPDGRRDSAALRRPRRRLRQVPALGRRPARRGPGRRRVALQRDQVHLALPRNPRDLELRLRLRRQRPAGQEVLRAAHRVGHRARRGLARRAHADPQADLAGGEGVLHRRRLPLRLRQDQPRHAAAHGPGLARRDHRRRHRLDALRRRRPPLRRQPRVRLLRRRAGHQLEDQPQRHAHHGRRQLDLHEHRAHRRQAMSGGRAWRASRST